MDSLLHPCRPRFLSESNLVNRQLLGRRSPLSSIVHLNCSFCPCNNTLNRRISPKPTGRGASSRAPKSFKPRKSVQTLSALWSIPYNPHSKFSLQHRFGGLSSSCGRGPRKLGIAHFEEANKNCSGDRATIFEDRERPPFNLDLAVILAGFAFEAYNTPAGNVGTHEKDAGDCETTYLALHFLRELYDGQIFVKLKKGMRFPGLDFWGTSDPYVVIRCGDCEARSRVVWATKDPVWNEEFTLNVKDPASQSLQIAAWDANVITAHRRMGNTSLSLGSLSDGKKHDVELQLKGMGGGGAVQLEVQYKSFADLEPEKSWWSLPSFTEIFHIKGVENAYNRVFGKEGIKAGDFVRSTLGSLPFLVQGEEEILQQGVQTTTEVGKEGQQFGGWFGFQKAKQEDTNKTEVEIENNDEGDYVRDVVQAVGRTLASFGVDVAGLPYFDRDTLQADREVTKRLGLEFQSRAEVEYVESGLALPPGQEEKVSAKGDLQDQGPSPQQLEEVNKSMMRNTENFLGLWAMVASSFPGSKKEENENRSVDASTHALAKVESSAVAATGEARSIEKDCEDAQENEAKRQMFQTAESAVEAWAMLATSLGGQSFVKSEFEKICFLENQRTDTEVAIWRDAQRRRLVVAFRGTEKTKWKDLSTDINVIPVGFNPERIGGVFKEEVMVHGGFLNAYDSVSRRLVTLVQASLGISDDGDVQKWQIYVTGHSLGGALATLFALELSSSKLAKDGHIQVTMYNFGSPRVGNKQFADMYNQKVRDSWRIVNHRDIIPTVPRLMGYCHVAQPIYLSAGGLAEAIVERDLLEDGYQGDIIGEVTPDFVFQNVMKGERRMLERLLQTEITMLRAIRDGSALMQHMEDFYYIALLERVERRMSQRI